MEGERRKETEWKDDVRDKPRWSKGEEQCGWEEKQDDVSMSEWERRWRGCVGGLQVAQYGSEIVISI